MACLYIVDYSLLKHFCFCVHVDVFNLKGKATASIREMYDILYSAGIVYITLNIVAVIVCTLAAILVFILELCNKLVYRLALYQVVAALFLAVMDILETTIFINYDENPKLYDVLCKAIGLLGMYSQWMKLLFTMWVTFHLFCFAVLHKNLKKLEVLYVVTSLLIPAVIACVPL